MKILIADDHKIIRSGLIALFKSEDSDIDISEASNGKEVIAKLKGGSFDVVLMDIGMPELNGIEATEIIMKEMPDTKILVFSAYDKEKEVRKMLELGALGYVLKDDAPDELFEAIKAVSEGKQYLSRNVSNKLLNNLFFKNDGKQEQVKAEIISERELEVLRYICDGFTNKEIGEKLNISERTVDSHRRNLLQKTNCKNSAELVKYAFTNNLIGDSI